MALAPARRGPRCRAGLLTGSWLDFFSALAVIFGHVQALVDDAWDGLDLCPQLLLDPLQVEAVVVGDEVDGEAQVSEAACTQQQWWSRFGQKAPMGSESARALTGSPDTMKVRFSQFGEVKVDHDIHSLDIDPPREQV